MTRICAGFRKTGRAGGLAPGAEMRDVRRVPEMRYIRGCSAAVVIAVIAVSAVAAAQQTPAQGNGPGRGGAGGGGLGAFPRRPPADPAVLERGKALYSVNCQFCHGADTRGETGNSR